MTKATKPVSRETEATVFSLGERRSIIVTIDRFGLTLGFRLKSHRRTFSLSTQDCYYQAVDQWAIRERAKKKAERRARKGR
jgi:hypothetical protein